MDSSKTAYFTFGRFQGLTIGHEHLIKTLGREADDKGVKAFIVISESHDNKKNPLPLDIRVKYLRMLARKNGCTILENVPKPVNYLTTLQFLAKEGYTHFKIFVGEDRVLEIDERVQRYVGKTAPNLDLTTVQEAKVVSVGNRNGIDDGIIGASGAKMRQFATESDLKNFKKFIPELLQAYAVDIMLEMRKGMGLYESAPPGMEETVEKLKPQLGEQKAYQVAWNSYNQTKTKSDVRENVIKQLFGDNL